MGKSLLLTTRDSSCRAALPVVRQLTSNRARTDSLAALEALDRQILSAAPQQPLPSRVVTLDRPQTEQTFAFSLFSSEVPLPSFLFSLSGLRELSLQRGQVTTLNR